MDDATRAKKNKQTQFHHARDNGVAALGKILKYQSASIDPPQLVPFWLGLMPLTHDMEEAKDQNEFLADTFLRDPKAILG